MQDGKIIKKVEHLVKTNLIIQKLYIITMSSIVKFLGVFIKSDKNQVLFSSMVGKTFGDSPKKLFDEMKNDVQFNNYKFVWAFENPELYDVDGAKKVKLDTLQYFLVALKSGIWITNVNIERSLHFKKRKTIYLYTGHGCCGPIKIAGNAQKNRNDYDFSDIDIICSSSNWHDEYYIRDFKANKKSLIRCGFPKNDDLYNADSNQINMLRVKYKIPLDKKVILYAPTWREITNNDNESLLAPPIDLDLWKKFLSDEYVLLFRAHHFTNKIMNIKFDEFVRDFSGDYNVDDLLKISDILISDYSGVITDYAIFERPTFLFVYDYESFIKNRGLYMKLEDLLPHCICKSEEDVISKIISRDFEDSIKDMIRLKHDYVYEGHDSTVICLNTLKEKIRER